jgi:hypothetical protein
MARLAVGRSRQLSKGCSSPVQGGPVQPGDKSEDMGDSGGGDGAGYGGNIIPVCPGIETRRKLGLRGRLRGRGRGWRQTTRLVRSPP